jgi:putative membrane protein
MRKALALVATVSCFVFGSMALTALAAEKGGEKGGLTQAEKTFIKDAASGGMMEVELGRVAQQNGKSQAVKDFGKKMETDHGAANDELKSLVSQKNAMVPAQMEKKEKGMVDKMTKLTGDEFDKKYMAAMVADHKKDIKKFKAASKKAKDPDLKAWVDKTLPTLEQHLQLATETAHKVGATVK